MKFRNIVFMLLLFIIFSSVDGYSMQKESELKGEKKSEAQLIADFLNNYIAQRIAKHKHSIKTLADWQELKKALLEEGNKEIIDNSNKILSTFCKFVDAAACYLMNAEGTTIISSNYDSPESFIGKNFSFRPYFKNAMKGFSSLYMAVGAITKKRGMFFSYPIYGESSNVPSGVTVIKQSLDVIVKKVNSINEGIILIVSPEGFIFVSNKKELLYKFLWKPEQDVVSKVEKSKQFGKGPWPWSGFSKTGKNLVKDRVGRKYRLYEFEFGDYEDWHVMCMYIQ